METHTVPLAAVEKPAPAWCVIGAAVRGTSHEKTGLPCQDAQDTQALADGTLLIALADGAGTAAFSDQGAHLTVRSALASLAAAFSSGRMLNTLECIDAMQTAFLDTRLALLDFAGEAGERARDYAATLTCVVLTPERLVCGQIGDGVVVAREAGGELFAATRPQRGEYANETHFLTQLNAPDLVDIQVCGRPVEAVAVMSDGLTRLAMQLPGYRPHEPFFRPLFDFAAGSACHNGTHRQAVDQLADFLRSERVCARTDDDKSLVLAVSGGGTA